MNTGQVSHGRVLTSLDDLVGALVVLNEVEHDVSLKVRFPQFERGYPKRAYRSDRRDHFGLQKWNAPRTCAHRSWRTEETCDVAHKCKEDARG